MCIRSSDISSGKSIAWEYLKFYTRPLMTWGGSRNESELRIDLFNGSRINFWSR